MKIENIIELITPTNLVEIIISEKEKKTDTEFKKIVIRPIIIKGEELCQIAQYNEKQVEHINVTYLELNSYIIDVFFNQYRQFLFRLIDSELHALKLGEKLKVNIKQVTSSVDKNHNKPKNYILNEGDFLPFLIEQGVMSNNYLIKANMQHKFRQINRYLEFIRDIVSEFDTSKTINIVDFGCGKSYLTFALYHYLHDMLNLRVQIHGLDLKQAVIDDCNSLAKKLKFEYLTFKTGDIATYQGDTTIDMVISLHACDTATDYAIYQAVKWDAKVIMAVPCCQHEINAQLSANIMNPLLKYGIIKERIASLLTDSLRANILEAIGYKTSILEFIETEHTPKNLLIRACKSKPNIDKWNEVSKQIQTLQIEPTLYKLFKEKYNA